jgi:hypothetical protein
MDHLKSSGVIMTDDEARTAVRTTIAVMAQLAGRTRSAADDLLVQILKSNETRLTTAVIDLLKEPILPTAERISAALSAVGIKA